MSGFHRSRHLWLYGNTDLLRATWTRCGKDVPTVLFCVADAIGRKEGAPELLSSIEKQAESLVLESKVLVTGIHNEKHQRSGIQPLRWGAPRILVFPCGFYRTLGDDLTQEPFLAARLWRYGFDPKTDLCVSLLAPSEPGEFVEHDPTIDCLIQYIVNERANIASQIKPS